MRRLTVDVRPGDYAIAKLPPGSAVPSLTISDGLVSVTSTPDEVSVVAPVAVVPPDATVDAGWRLLTVRGPLEFTLTGIMASLAGSLAAAGVPLYAMSTYDTDHILVKATDLDRAVGALREAGHEVHA